jgi:hypothetical protein
MKRFGIAASLTCLATIGHAAAFFGLQARPSWSERGDLTVAVANGSKLTLRVESVAATVSGGGGEPCEWAATPAFPLGPTDTRVVMVADRNAVEACLRGRQPAVAADAATLHFVPVAAEKEDRGSTELRLRVAVRVKQRDRSLENVSTWSVRHGKR